MVVRRIDEAQSDFRFIATGVGSVPFLDVQGTCLSILRHLPEIPYWPQFVRRSLLEDMSIQFSEGLPLLKIIEDKRSLVISGDLESELTTFYDRFLAEDTEYFAISREYAPGLYELLSAIEQSPKTHGPYIKGQSVGPITFSAGITDEIGKSILHHADLREAMVKGLSIKALWQVRTLSQSGKRPIIFLDEPYLSGYGSAFTPIQRDEVISLIKEVIDYLRERSETLVGVHCCGNTDWSMIMEAGPDIISFDAFGYLDYFLLYPEAIIRYLGDGGIIAWGIVPTVSFTGKESVEGLCSRLQEGLHRLSECGLDSGTLNRNSMLTPACGLGTMDQASAERALELLSMLSSECAEAEGLALK
jgi:methionine synthase II (cobalamin-independent)